ncbi:14869_t:CDS:2, partial [Dentiscutata heterogama]
EKSKAKTTNAHGGVGITSILKPEINVVHGDKDMNNNYISNTSNDETIIGGTEIDYSVDDNKSWLQSLNNAAKWKIIGYEDVYSLFELLNEELKKKASSIMGHQILEDKNPYIHQLPEIKNISECNILASIISEENNVFSLHMNYMDGDKNRPVIVIHHIQGKKVKDVKIKLGWIIIGPPASFDFIIQYPLVFKSKKYQFRDKVLIKSNNSMFGICVLEAPNITSQVENGSDIRTLTSHQIKYDPRKSPFAIGNYLIRQELEPQVVAQWFFYDIKAKKNVTDQKILERLSLYS